MAINALRILIGQYFLQVMRSCLLQRLKFGFPQRPVLFIPAEIGGRCVRSLRRP